MAISPSSAITLTLVALATGIFSYFAANNVYDFVNQPYVLATSHVSTSSMKMPPITLCPVSWLDNGQISGSFDTVLIEFLMNGFLDEMLVDAPYEGNASLADRIQKYDDFVADRPDFNIKMFLQELQSDCKDELVECEVGKDTYTDACCEDYVTPRSLKNVGGCWSFDGSIEQKMPGPGGGLTLYLTTNDYVEGIVRNTLPTVGYVLFVDDKPSVARRRPIFVNDDTLTAVGLWATQHVSLTNCVSEDNYPKTRFFEHMNPKTASKELCVYDCTLWQVVDTCGCILFTEGVTEDEAPYCTPAEIESCVLGELFRDNLTDIYQECDSVCPKLCNYTEYSWDTSYSTINSGMLELTVIRTNDILTNSTGKIGGTRKRRQPGGGGMDGGGMDGGGMDGGGMESGGMGNLTGVGRTGLESVLLKIYMADLGYTLKEEEPTETWSSLVSNIGGQIGMWLGLSLLSLQQLLTKLYINYFRK